MVEKIEQHKSGKPCFLIVDNDHQSVVSVSSMLKNFGSRVDAANCVSAALNCLRASLYDVVIADMDMKDGDGPALVCQIKNNFPNVKTITMTKQHGSGAEHHIKACNADGFIPKPFNINDLESVLNDFSQTDSSKKADHV